MVFSTKSFLVIHGLFLPKKNRELQGPPVVIFQIKFLILDQYDSVEKYLPKSSSQYDSIEKYLPKSLSQVENFLSFADNK